MPGPVVGVVAYSLALPDRPPAQAVGRRYTDALRAAGCVPWLVPLAPDDPGLLAAVAARLDGVCLTGGPDVDPARYGERRRPECGESDPDRDATELEMLRAADARGLPVLAICRGLQVLNVARGGTLYQDIPTQVPAALQHRMSAEQHCPPRDAVAHEVTAVPGTRLAAALGEAVVAVNSLHHQAVKDLGSRLTVTGLAPDGIVEAIEGNDAARFVVGVQWHPEELADAHPGMRALFAAFAAACREGAPSERE